MRSRFGARSSVHMTCYKRPMRLHDYAPRPAHIRWLLDSDPAIRWQVMRDLTDDAANAIAAERSRVATEGWGTHCAHSESCVGITTQRVSCGLGALALWLGSKVAATLPF
jgi:hypothetical protein